MVAWNPAAERLFGYTSDEALGRNLDDLVATTDDLHRSAVSITQIIDKKRVDAITRRTRKDGSLVDVELHAAPLMVDGTPVGTFGVYHDITELQRQKQYYESLLQVSPAAVVGIDNQDLVTLWNPASERLFGYTAEEALGRNIDDLVAAHPEVRAEAEQFNREAEAGQIRRVSRRTRKDGSLVDVELLGAPIHVGGELMGRYAIYLDVSELQRQKQYYEGLLEVSPTPIIAIDPQGMVTSWNPAAERLFGYTAQEAVGQHIDDLVANRPELREEALDVTRRIAEEQVSFLARRTRKDGSLVDVQVTGAPVHVGGELVGMYGFFHDISELQEQKRFYEALVELSPTAIAVQDLNATVTAWNPAAERIFGYTAEEAIGQNLDDLVAKRPDLHDQATGFSQAAARGERMKAFARRTRKDGSLVDVEIVSEPIDVAGERVGFLAIYHDVTELQERKRYFEALLEVSPTAIVVQDLDANVTSWNPAAERLFGYTAEEAIGRNLDDLIATRADLHEEAVRFSEAGQRREGARAITRRTRKDGSLVDVELVFEPVIVANEHVGFVVVYHDISELQRQKQYYASVLELSPTAIITVDDGFEVTSWNPTAERLFGYTAEEALGRNIDDLVAAHPEVRAEAEAQNEPILAGETRRLITRRMRKDGTLVDVELSVAPVHVGEERVGFSIVYHDIGEIQRQRRYYEALFQSSPVAIALQDRNGKVTSWNPAAEKLFGYSAEEAIGRHIDDLVAADEGLRVEADALQARGMAGELVHAISRRTRKDGSLVDVEMFGAPVMVAEEPAGLYAMYHDIGEIQRQRRYYQALIQSSPVAIALLDPKGTVNSWNPSAERLFGYSADEAVGRNIDDLVATSDEIREEARAQTQQGMRGGFVHGISRRTRKDGTLVDVEIFGAPVMVAGEPAGLYAMYHDIGPLQQARKAAEAAAEAKSAFLATMSHEIRTPLNAVIGMTGLLLDTKLTPEQHGYGEVIRSSGDALLAVINEILDFSKIEAGRLDLEREPFSLRQCVESALELVATSAADKGLDLAYLIDPRTPATIVGDVTRVRQILLNLLNNSVKFTDVGEIVVRVDARPLEPSGNGGVGRYEVHFGVRDTGIGIPEDRMGALFEAFSQVDASTTRRYGGTGLGLAISKRLAEQMGGTLRAESTPGRGSTFHVTIAAEAVAGPSTEELEAIPQLEGRRVLVVDDNATNREILRRQTEAWGMEPLETESPPQALQWVARGDPFDLAILDMQMPDMDGLTLAKEIRRHRDASALPLVLLTSLGRVDRGETEVFAARLTKPIRPSQLHDVLVGIFAPQLALQRVPTPVPDAAEGPAEWKPLRILIAEDNAVNQRVAMLVLGKLGYRADVAGDGREAVEALERQPYDVVLMDVQMPEMDGLEATREIRRRWPGPERRPRIIAMTAGATEDDRRACLAAGMDDYVSKPIRQEELAAALSRSGTSSSGAAPAIDRDTLDRLRDAVGGDEAVGELTGTFLDDTKRLLAELHQDLEAGRADDVRRHAHTLKSTAASFGAEALAELSRRLENLAGAEAPDQLAGLVDDIEAEFGRVAAALSDG